MEHGNTKNSRVFWIPIILLALIAGFLLAYFHPRFLSSFFQKISFSYKFQLLWSVLVVIAISIFIELIRRSYLSHIVDLKARHKVRSYLHWVRIFTIVAALVFIWAGGVKNYGVVFGLVGAGLALSLQELILSIVGWIYIMINHPFDIGDRIEVEELKGDVVDISVLHSTLVEISHDVDAEQSTGRLLMIPNSSFIRRSFRNFTKGFAFVWNELPIVVTFESDWQKAKDIILRQSAKEDAKFKKEVDRQIRETQEKYAIRIGKYSSIVYTSIDANGVSLTLRYLCPARAKRSTAHDIYENILKHFAKEPGIDFAYPTTRFYKTSADLVQLNGRAESSIKTEE